MTMPNAEAGLSPNIDLAFAVSANGSLQERAELDQPTVQAILKQRVKASAGWNQAHNNAYGGLLGGPMPLVTNIFATLGKALFGWIPTTIANIGDALSRIGNGIVKFVGGLIPGLDASKIISGKFAKEMIAGIEQVPLIGDLVEVLIGKEDGNLNDLGTYFNNVRSFFGSMDFSSAVFNTVAATKSFISNTIKPFSDLLFAFFPPRLLPLIPLSNIGNVNPNLLLNGGFDDEVSLDGSSDFTWDGTVGRTGVGSAKAVITTPKKRVLYSNQIPVANGQKITAKAYVKYQNATNTTGTGEIQLSIESYAGSTVVSTTVVDSLSNPSGTINTWAIMQGNYEVADETVDSIRLTLTINTNMTGGTVWFDDCNLHKTGLLEMSWINQLETVIAGINAFATETFNKAFEALQKIGKVVIGLVAAPVQWVGNLAKNIVDSIGSTIGGFIDHLHHIFSRGRVGSATAPALTTVTPTKSVAELMEAAQEVVTVTYDTNFSTVTHSEFFNTPRLLPSWIGANTDDVAYAQTLIDTTGAPPLGRLILIPVKVSQDRIYDAIKFGIIPTSGSFTMDSIYVGLYEVDEITGACTKVLGSDLGASGNVKKFLDTGYNVQTIPIATTIGGTTTAASGNGATATLTLSSSPAVEVGDSIQVAGVTPTGYNGKHTVTAVSKTAPYSVSYASTTTGAQTVSGLVVKPAPISVQKGELYYIGILQVGGTSNQIHYWNKSSDFTSGQFPRYLGMYYSSGSAIGALPESFANTLVLSGTKYWGALGTDTPEVASSSVFYSDSFNRIASDLGSSWSIKYGQSNALSTGDSGVELVGGQYVTNYVVKCAPSGYATASYVGRLGSTNQEAGISFDFFRKPPLTTGPTYYMDGALMLHGNGFGQCVYARVHGAAAYSSSTGSSSASFSVRIYTTTSYSIGADLSSGVAKTSSVSLTGPGSNQLDGTISFRATPIPLGYRYEVIDKSGNVKLTWDCTDGSNNLTSSSTEVGFSLASTTPNGSTTVLGAADKFYAKDI